MNPSAADDSGTSHPDQTPHQTPHQTPDQTPDQNWGVVATPTASGHPTNSPLSRVVAILNQKGGVGKTTATLGLASAAAAAGRSVLVIDMDPQGSSSWVMGVDLDDIDVSVGDVLRKAPLVDAIHPTTWGDAIHVVPARPDQQELEDGKGRRLAKALERCAADPHFDLDRYEAILVDCPPSLGNLTANALAAARHALIVVEPSALGLRGIGGVADTIDDVWDRYNPDLELSGVVLNRVPAVSSEAERRIDELSRIVGRDAIWQPAIPQRVVFNQAVGERRPIHSYGRRAREPIEVFDRLWAAVRRTVHA